MKRRKKQFYFPFTIDYEECIDNFYLNSDTMVLSIMLDRVGCMIAALFSFNFPFQSRMMILDIFSNRFNGSFTSKHFM